MGFEPTMPVFERTNTVHALDTVATVICISRIIHYIKICRQNYLNIIQYKISVLYVNVIIC
jgi:hypothetical protein